MSASTPVRRSPKASRASRSELPSALRTAHSRPMTLPRSETVSLTACARSGTNCASDLASKHIFPRGFHQDWHLKGLKTIVGLILAPQKAGKKVTYARDQD